MELGGYFTRQADIGLDCPDGNYYSPSQIKETLRLEGSIPGDDQLIAIEFNTKYGDYRTPNRVGDLSIDNGFTTSVNGKTACEYWPTNGIDSINIPEGSAMYKINPDGSRYLYAEYSGNSWNKV